MARPKEALIAKETVVETAARIMARDGFEALSLRRLGAELKVNSASLYHHFEGKDDILRAVARAALKAIDLPPPSADWRGWIGRAAVGFRHLLIDRPYLVPLMLGQPRPRTLAIAVTDERLAEAGVSPAMRAEFLQALDMTVIGSALVAIASAKAAAAQGEEERPAAIDHDELLRTTIGMLLDRFVSTSADGA
ncbi:helix-turn-helix transcriptional regulator [Sphingomonas sp. CGMCC 1.13654]|uniref:Helix-turn-helix transcriptional regulator n=1 Tax=Sphingomonas chungangi TaxID=2683589 RepID=A0A838L3H4_9SPHN|nr:helix-turn-helix domain-containing protein [Sphingomonas chungangi]MBA2933734.1 helix-turn-helix transcriptional regulator [Sphingomonas chungangi]MVW55065.1 TetR family transcriptional regulator [Sphingomonas chungangi]